MSQNLSRRSVAKGVAWSVPAVGLAAVAPAFASSQNVPGGFDDPNTPEIDGCSTALVRTNYTGDSTVVGGPKITWTSPDHPDELVLQPGKPAVVYTVAGEQYAGCGLQNLSFYVSFPIRKKLHARADDEYEWTDACQAPVQAKDILITGAANKDGSAYLIPRDWYNTDKDTSKKSAPVVGRTDLSGQGPTKYSDYPDGRQVDPKYDPYNPVNLSNPYANFAGPIRLTGKPGESRFVLTYTYKAPDNADPGFGTFTLTQEIIVRTVTDAAPEGALFVQPYCEW